MENKLHENDSNTAGMKRGISHVTSKSAKGKIRQVAKVTIIKEKLLCL